jgi:hypothetical protein
MIEAESLESAYIGAVNKRFPKAMPWLTSIHPNCSFFTNIRSQPYTTWSAAGLFVTECGLPLVSQDVFFSARQRAGLDKRPSSPCLGSFLKAAGYKLFAVSAGSCAVMNMRSFLIRHGWDVRDFRVHHQRDDDGTFDVIYKNFLPFLSNQKMWPFALLVMNSDTHPWPFHISARCQRQLNVSLPETEFPLILQSFGCLDNHLRNFTMRMEELGLNQNSEFVIFGDHLTMSDSEVFNGIERNLSIIFPWRPQDDLWKRGTEKLLTYYDFAPTIMNMLGLEYWPPFPFGSDIFGETSGDVPETVDLQYLYGLATGDFAARTVKCLGRRGFCQGNEMGRSGSSPVVRLVRRHLNRRTVVRFRPYRGSRKIRPRSTPSITTRAQTT